MGDQGQFNKVLGLMNEYDNKLTKVVECYDNAMTSLTYLKFNNPYCPVTTRGFKVTPALKKVNNNLQVVVEKADSDTQQQQEQERIEKQLQKQMKEENKIDIVNRFGTISQRSQIEVTKNQFDNLVELILDLARTSLTIRHITK